jgi:hypothetical protein
MRIKLEITEEELRELVVREMRDRINNSNGTFEVNKVQILVKSTQNYKSEWEPAKFKATYEGDV